MRRFIYIISICVIIVAYNYATHSNTCTRPNMGTQPALVEAFHEYQQSCQAINHLDKNNQNLLHILKHSSYPSENKPLGHTLYQRLENMSVKLERVKKEKDLLGNHLFRVSDFITNHHKTRNTGLNSPAGLKKFKKTLHNLRANPIMPVGTISKWQVENKKIDAELTKIKSQLKGMDKETREVVEDTISTQHYRPKENTVVAQQVTNFMRKVVPAPDPDPRVDYWDRAKKVTAGNTSTAKKPTGMHKDIDYFDNTGCNEPRPGCCPFPNDVKGRCFYDMRVEQLAAVSLNDFQNPFKTKSDRYKKLEKEICESLYSTNPAQLSAFKKRNKIGIVFPNDIYKLGKGSNQQVFKDWIKNPKCIPPMCRHWKFHDSKRQKWCAPVPLPVFWKYKNFKKVEECPDCPHGLQKIHPIWPKNEVSKINATLNQLRLMYKIPQNRKKILEML